LRKLGHPPYSLYLVPSSFHLFPKVKEFLGGKQMATNGEIKETVMDWLNRLAANLYDEEIVKLVQRLEKCLNCNGYCIKK
jgi:hypothetical protein